MKTHWIEQLKQKTQGKEHIIWDWNGTLLDDVEHAVQVVNSMLIEHQLPLLTREKYRQIFDFPVINFYRAAGFDFEKESFEDLCHKFVDRFIKDVKNLPLIAGIKNLLLQLHQDKRTQSVLSATDQPNLDAMITHFELREIFKFVYGIQNKFAASKIERGHELIAISQIPLSKTLMIGDTLHDLEVAQALGIDALLLGHGHQCSLRLRRQHDTVLELE